MTVRLQRNYVLCPNRRRQQMTEMTKVTAAWSSRGNCSEERFSIIHLQVPVMSSYDTIRFYCTYTIPAHIHTMAEAKLQNTGADHRQ